MNIFNTYLDRIIRIINLSKKNKSIKIPDNLDGINVSIPPAKFDFDISTNVAMVLAKTNKKSPTDIGNQIIDFPSEYVEIEPNIVNGKVKADPIRFNNVRKIWNLTKYDSLFKKRWTFSTIPSTSNL